MNTLAIAAALAATLAAVLGTAAAAPSSSRVTSPPAPQLASPPAANPAAQPGGEPGAAFPPGLADLEKTTFACPKAALNAAAREVGTYRSQGTYQFSYFNVVSGSHHAAYEVHFTSNVSDEPVLRFCVAVYCQQGFDPSTTTNVMLMEPRSAPPKREAASASATGAAAGGTHAMSGGHAANPCAPARARNRRPARR